MPPTSRAHADADVRARAHRLLTITCARLGALDVLPLGKKQRGKTSHAPTHPETFRGMIEAIQEADRTNDQTAAERKSDAEKQELVKINKFRADETDRVAQAHRDEQQLTSETRAAVADYERKMEAYFVKLRHAIERLLVVDGLVKIVKDIDLIFDSQLDVSRINDMLAEKRQEAATAQATLAHSTPALPVALNTPIMRTAHERTLAAWQALHITQGFYMEKPVHRAPLVPLAHRRI